MCVCVGGGGGGGTSETVIIDVVNPYMPRDCLTLNRAQELCESRGGRFLLAFMLLNVQGGEMAY